MKSFKDFKCGWIINNVNINKGKNFQFFGEITIKASPPIYLYIKLYIVAAWSYSVVECYRVMFIGESTDNVLQWWKKKVQWRIGNRAPPLSSLYCTVYSVQCTLHTIHFTHFTVKCIICTAHWPLWTVPSERYTVHCTQFLFIMALTLVGPWSSRHPVRI